MAYVPTALSDVSLDPTAVHQCVLLMHTLGKNETNASRHIFKTDNENEFTVSLTTDTLVDYIDCS